jgi:4-hydroxythreonine-4-phosphate dehydrogenase
MNGPSSDAAEPKPLAVSMGDPAGIGLDIVLSAWRCRHEYDLPPFGLIADPDAVDQRAQTLGARGIRLAVIAAVDQASEAFADALPIVPVALSVPAEPGRPTSRNAGATISAIERAVDAVAEGRAAAIVTCPIAKSVLYDAGFGHPGHTEFLGALAQRHWPEQPSDPVMMLAAAELRVVPLTVHIPIAAVPAAISTARIIKTGRILAGALRSSFGIPAPRIAVAGLNPHAGEAGTIGREDIDIIAPAIRALHAEGINSTGPHSADTLFHDAARATYDAVIAMFHDQALIPIKTLAFDRGVNVTLGLPFIRTSPDHGTAFDIAGTGNASPTSFIEALKLAAQMSAAATARPI